MRTRASLKKGMCMCAMVLWCIAMSAGAQPTTRIDKDGNRSPVQMTVRISNPDGVYRFRRARSGGFRQQISEVTDTSLQIRVTVPQKFPEYQQAFPMTEPIPERAQRFIAPTDRVQSNAPEIERVAREIIASAQPQTAAEYMRAVCGWMRTNVPYSGENPSEITDALTALSRGKGHAIGASHLAAALFRNQGIPARIVRTFCVYTDGPEPRLSRHSLVEVYLPKDQTWVLIHPHQYGPVAPQHIYLYSAPDWDQEAHDASKPLSVSPKTRIEVLGVE